MIYGPEKDMDLNAAVTNLESMMAVLDFLRVEWMEANKLLTELGYPEREEDEYGDYTFIRLEERIRRAVNEQ